MTNKNGSILLEVLIAATISAFILSSLYTILSQVNSNVTRMNNISSIDMRAFVLQNQLERDLSGAFIIYERKPKENKDQEKKDVVDKGQDKTGTEEVKKEKKQEYENVPIKRGFFSENNGDNIKILTFITNNPLKSFDKPKPLIARIVYKLVEDTQVKTGLARGVRQPVGASFKLFRQEGATLGFDEFNKVVPKSTDYELIKNIKKLSLEYTTMIKPGEDNDKKDEDKKSQGQAANKSRERPQEQEKEQKIEYKNFKKWTDDEIKKTKKYRPDFCKFIVELWDDGKKTFKTFEFKIYIYQVVAKPEEKKNEQVQQSQFSKFSSLQGQNDQAGLGNNSQGNINLDIVLGEDNFVSNSLRHTSGFKGVDNGAKKGSKMGSLFRDAFLNGNKP